MTAMTTMTVTRQRPSTRARRDAARASGLRSALLALLALATIGCTPSEEPVAHAESAPARSGDEATRDAELFELLDAMGVRLHGDAGTIEVDGWVNMNKGLVEVFACAPEGKTHESVVVLDCVPSGLHAGLMALGLAAGTPVESGTEADYRAPSGDAVVVEVRWTDASGVEHRTRAEDWVWNVKEERAMEPVEWVFTGSLMQPVPGAPGETSYAANAIRSLVTTYHDATTVLENPLAAGRDDTVYHANERAVPEPGTKVTVQFRAAR